MFGWRSPPPTLRPLTAEDAESCAILHGESFAQAWSSEEFAALMVASSGFGDAAVMRDGRLAGFVLSRIAGDEAEILTIAVAARDRKRGIARQLLVEHFAGLARRGVTALFLEVNDDNVAARRLYDRNDFVKVGERPGYYRKPDGSRALALVLRRDV